MASAGLDVVDVSFDLGDFALPQDIIFLASVKAAAGMELGLNLFEPPVVGTSDNTFLMVDTGVISPAVSANRDVYFQLTAVPEPSTISLLGFALAAGIWLRRAR